CSITRLLCKTMNGAWTCRSSLSRKLRLKKSWCAGTNSRPSRAHYFHRRKADSDAFRYSDLQGDALFKRFHVTDHANHLAARIQRVEGVQRDFQCLAIERAETFIEEQGVNGRLET